VSLCESLKSARARVTATSTLINCVLLFVQYSFLPFVFASPSSSLPPEVT